MLYAYMIVKVPRFVESSNLCVPSFRSTLRRRTRAMGSYALPFAQTDPSSLQPFLDTRKAQWKRDIRSIPPSAS